MPRRTPCLDPARSDPTGTPATAPFTQGLTLAHLDAHLQDDERARAWLTTAVDDDLAARGVEAWQFAA